MKTTEQSSLPDITQEARRLARDLDQFFVQRRTEKGEPLNEGMVYAALGILFASKASDETQCRDIITNVYTAIYSAFRLRPPK